MAIQPGEWQCLFFQNRFDFFPQHKHFCSSSYCALFLKKSLRGFQFSSSRAIHLEKKFFALMKSSHGTDFRVQKHFTACVILSAAAMGRLRSACSLSGWAGLKTPFNLTMPLELFLCFWCPCVSRCFLML